MALFRILREVRLFSPGEWQLCFQFGTYDLQDGAEALRWAAQAQRAEWQRWLGAADPVPGAEQLQRLATCLEKAASLNGVAREDFLRESVSKPDLKTIASWARSALNPSFAADEHE